MGSGWWVHNWRDWSRRKQQSMSFCAESGRVATEATFVEGLYEAARCSALGLTEARRQLVSSGSHGHGRVGEGLHKAARCSAFLGVSDEVKLWTDILPRNKEMRETIFLKIFKYLKAVILEGLRCHRLGHFVLPHVVTEDVVLDDHVVSKNASVFFIVAEMGWDPKVWKDPMAFKPEGYVDNDNKKVEFDVSGNREMKMMPFSVGRRICPGSTLAMLHLKYFMANLVWKFE
ncbi:Cytochrome P450, E-class, group I [Trema orientale]|uniref:Cytochrome P450, E-class, group I n=1 Tax=Trema orientale TaxID=63057 RepID=A0A2P5F4U5_TREOI|nr:Cytochrome P450, E-class, group I [Trema orientale]